MKNNRLNIKQSYLLAIAVAILLCLVFFVVRFYVKYTKEYSQSYLTPFDSVLNLVSAMLLGTIALFFSVYTFRRQQEQKSIKTAFQKEILEDIIWRFYRAKVVISAIQQEFQKAGGYDKGYPSEVCFMQIKIPYKNILIERFNHPKKFNEILKLALEIDKYNEWLDILLEHSKIQDFEKDQKKDEFSNFEKRLPGWIEETQKLMHTLNLSKENSKNIIDKKRKEKEKRKLLYLDLFEEFSEKIKQDIETDLTRLIKF